MGELFEQHPSTSVANFDEIRFVEPFGFLDFITLERDARCVLTDSGTVQEECCIFRVPNVTLRDVTERPETVDCGSNILSGAAPDAVARCVRIALERHSEWSPPEEYLVPSVSSTVVNIVLGHHHPTAGSGGGFADR